MIITTAEIDRRELRVRNLTKVDIDTLDKLAHVKKQSREEFVRRLIHNYVSTYYVSGEFTDSKELNRQALFIIEQNTIALNRIFSLLN